MKLAAAICGSGRIYRESGPVYPAAAQDRDDFGYDIRSNPPDNKILPTKRLEFEKEGSIFDQPSGKQPEPKGFAQVCGLPMHCNATPRTQVRAKRDGSPVSGSLEESWPSTSSLPPATATA